MPEAWRSLFGPDRRILTLVVLILLVSMFVAFGTGFWLLFRLVYVIALAVPLAWLLVWWNTRDIDADVDRRTSRAQVGQEAQEIIEVRNRAFLPKVWLEIEDPSDLPGHRSKRVVPPVYLLASMPCMLPAGCPRGARHSLHRTGQRCLAPEPGTFAGLAGADAGLY